MQIIKDFGKWLFKPLAEITKEPLEEIVSSVQDNTLNTEEETELPRTIITKKKSKTVFRPDTWEEYIGQEKAKDTMKSYIEAMIKREQVLGHVIIHGPAGTGKTTLAEIIANELKVKMQELIASSVDDADSLIKLRQKSKKGVVFVDEIHALPRTIVEQLYTVMEDFKFNGMKLNQFTLIGATTELGEIIKDRRPFYDRFKIIIELEEYSVANMVYIAKQYKNKTFPNDKFKNENYFIIARNSRGVPRMAIRLLEATVYLENVKQVLKNFRIIHDGYTEKDLKTLKYIATNEKGVGMQSIASYLGTSSQGYLYEVEPYLLQTGLLIRAPRGRKLSPTGYEMIKKLEKVQ